MSFPFLPRSCRSLHASGLGTQKVSGLQDGTEYVLLGSDFQGVRKDRSYVVRNITRRKLLDRLSTGNILRSLYPNGIVFSTHSIMPDCGVVGTILYVRILIFRLRQA